MYREAGVFGVTTITRRTAGNGGLSRPRAGPGPADIFV